MKKFSYIAIVLIAFGQVLGCSSSSDSGSNPHDSSNTSGRLAVRLIGHRLRSARTGESYVLWFKYIGDTSWYKASTVTVGYIDLSDNVTNFFYLNSAHSLSQYSEALVSLERTVGATPTLPLMHGTFTVSDTAKAVLSASAIGDFSSLTSDLVFTSASTDPTAYTKEFYLTSFDGSKYKPSLSALPALAAPWKYGLWAVDSNYSPDELIFYGLFTTASGRDSYQVGDNLPFPGGDGRHPMNEGTGSIIVTLEPDLYGNNVGTLGPTAYTLLRFDRRRYIVRDSNYHMTNVAASGIPTGRIEVFKP